MREEGEEVRLFHRQPIMEDSQLKAEISRLSSLLEEAKNDNRYLYANIKLVASNNVIMRDCLACLLDWVDGLPIKHPQQAEYRDMARKIVKGDC